MANRRLVAPGLLALLLLAGAFPPLLWPQKTSKPTHYVPEELRGSDPEVRAVLDAARDAADDGEYEEASAKAEKALELARAKGFVGDRALAETAVGQATAAKGKLAEALVLYRAALQDAVDSSNRVLESQLLGIFGAYSQMEGRLDESLSRLAKGVDAARKSQNVYAISSALGTQARVQIATHKVSEARSALEEALRIDTLNHYDDLKCIHQVYLAYVIGLESPKEFEKPVPQLEEAIDTAISSDNYYALSLGLTTLGAVYVYEGKTDQGLPILDGLLDGKVVYRDKTPRNAKAFRAALQMPFIRGQVLETMAIVYGAAGKPDQALIAWSKLFDFSKDVNSTLMQAEAANNIADIYRNRGQVDDALHYYGLAAEGWRSLPNEARLTAALISTGDLLLKNDRGQEAVPIAQELLTLAKKQNDYRLQFSVAFELGKYYGRTNDVAHAIEYLARAERLSSTQAEVKADDRSLSALYTVLSVQYEKTNDTLNAVVALEKGILVADRLKDQESLGWMLPVLRQKLELMKAWESADRYYGQQNYRQALVYSELLNLAGLTRVWKGDAEETKNLTRLWRCPALIVQESGGAEFLEENLIEMGAVLGAERRLVLSVLVNYFSAKANNQKAFELAAKALPLIPAVAAGPPLYFDVNLRCSYVLSALLTNNQKAAAQQVGLCLAGATDLKEPTVLAFAKRLAASVAEAQSAQGVAQEYLSYLATSNPNDPQPHIEMAWNYFQIGKEAEAFVEWKIAISLEEKAGDKAKLAQAHQAIAALLTTRPSPAINDMAAEHLRAAQGLFHELQDTGGEVSVLVAMANLASQAHHWSDARRCAEQALAIAESSKRDDLTANATAILGDSYAAAGDNAKALSLRLKAVDLYKKTGNKTMQATATLSVAWSLYYLHKPDEALREALAAKDVADESGNWFPRYSARYGLAAYYNARGNFERSLGELEEALTVCRAAGPLGQQSTVNVLLYLAGTLQLLGQDQEALDDALEALQIAQRLGDKQSQLLVYSDLVSIYGDRTSTVRDFKKALEAYQAGQALADTGKPNQYNFALFDIVEVYFQTQQYDKVVLLARQQVESCRANKNTQCEAHGWMSLAEGVREQGKLAEAEAALKKAEPLVEHASDYYTTGRFYYGQAGLAFKEGHYQQAVDLYLKVAGMLEHVQGGATQEQQKAVQESYAFIYDDLIATLFALGQQQPRAQASEIPATALEQAEASKAHGFVSSWGRVFVREMRRRLPAEVQEQERVLLSRQADLATQLAEAKAGKAEQLEKGYSAATEQVNAFVASLRKSYPGYAAVRFPEPLKLAALPVRTGEVVVEFKVTDQATYVWMIGSSAGGAQVVAFYKVAQTREWLNQRILKIREAYNRSSPEDFEPAVSTELFAALFPQPYAQHLKAATAITFIPDDILFLIPFEMLSPDAARGEYILAGIPTSYYPSLAALSLSRAATHHSEWQEAFLGVGDPVSSQDDDRYALARVLSPDAGTRGFAMVSPEDAKKAEAPATAQGFSFARLPGTAIEVQEIAKLFPRDRAETRLGLQATKQLVLDTDLSRFRYLHFATHGFLPVGGGKLEPALILSYDGGDPQQMKLTLSEILRLHLNADMVVLSACNTGSGTATRADGVANLGRAFMAAGASSATVSLWSVADKSTALLMEDYYRNLAAGKSKAESLARARTFIQKKGYKSPYYWAGFVLMGE